MLSYESLSIYSLSNFAQLVFYKTSQFFSNSQIGPSHPFKLVVSFLYFFFDFSDTCFKQLIDIVLVDQVNMGLVVVLYFAVCGASWLVLEGLVTTIALVTGYIRMNQNVPFGVRPVFELLQAFFALVKKESRVLSLVLSQRKPSSKSGRALLTDKVPL